jgi:hypothetical protein
MDTGGKLREYSRIQTSDPGMIAAMRSWEKTPDWRWEEWDKIPGYAEELNAGKATGRITPLQIADRLRTMADSIRRYLQDAESVGLTASHSAEWRSTKVDLQLLAGLAEYHAEKLSAAAVLTMLEGHDGFSQQTMELMGVHISTVHKHLQNAHAAWKNICAVTDGVYHENLVFGITPDSPRSKLGHHHSGHWSDRLAEMESELEALRRQLPEKTLPPEWKLRLPLLIENRSYVQRTTPAQAKELDGMNCLCLPHEVHMSPKSHRSGDDLNLSMQFRFGVRPERVVLHWRPLNQTIAWREVEMKPMGPADDSHKSWSVTVPAAEIDGKYDLQYFVRYFDNGTRQHPRYIETLPGLPYFVLPIETK